MTPPLARPVASSKPERILSPNAPRQPNLPLTITPKRSHK